MGTTYYIQICPTCGRRLEVKVEYLGLEVSCYHCRARFMAESSYPRYLAKVQTIPDLELGTSCLGLQTSGLAFDTSS